MEKHINPGHVECKLSRKECQKQLFEKEKNQYFFFIGTL